MGVACSNSSNAESNDIALLIVGIYLTLAAVGIIYMYVKVNKAKIDELTGCLNRRAYKDDLSGNLSCIGVCLCSSGCKRVKRCE